MRKFLVIVVLAIQLFYCNMAPAALAGQAAVLGSSGTMAPPCRTPKFRTLSRYKDNNWWKVFRDRAVAPALRTLLKSDYRKLIANLKVVDYPDSLSFVDSDGVLTLVGGVPGLYTISEAILIIEPCGNIYAVILDGGERFLYYTNDREHADNLTPVIQKWISNVERRRSGDRELPKLPIMFKSR